MISVLDARNLEQMRALAYFKFMPEELRDTLLGEMPKELRKLILLDIF